MNAVDKTIAAAVLRKEVAFAAISLLGAAVQWYRAGWWPALMLFFWVFALLNIPLLWAMRGSLVARWRTGKWP